MKKIVFNLITLCLATTLFGAISDEEYKKLITEDPSNAVYPKVIIKEAIKYAEDSKALYDNSEIPKKYAELIALAVSTAYKCQYCIPFHKSAAKEAGATDEEIKIAINIAADVAGGSTLLYGNEYDLESFKKELNKK